MCGLFPQLWCWSCWVTLSQVFPTLYLGFLMCAAITASLALQFLSRAGTPCPAAAQAAQCSWGLDMLSCWHFLCPTVVDEEIRSFFSFFKTNDTRCVPVCKLARQQSLLIFSKGLDLQLRCQHA